MSWTKQICTHKRTIQFCVLSHATVQSKRNTYLIHVYCITLHVITSYTCVIYIKKIYSCAMIYTCVIVLPHKVWLSVFVLAVHSSLQVPIHTTIAVHSQCSNQTIENWNVLKCALATELTLLKLTLLVWKRTTKSCVSYHHALSVGGQTAQLSIEGKKKQPCVSFCLIKNVCISVCVYVVELAK